MIKNFVRATLLLLSINVFSFIIYFILYICGLISVYELEEDYLGNFHIYLIMFILSSVITFVIACFLNLNKKEFIVFAVEHILFGLLSNIFCVIWFNINFYSFFVILKRIVNNIFNQDFTDDVCIKIISLFLSLIWSMLIMYIGGKIKKQKFKEEIN